MAGASGKVTYADAYRAVKVRRRAELASLQKVATDNNPFSRFLLGTFFLGFAGMMLLMFPPLSAVGGVVGVFSFGSGVKLYRVRTRVRRTVEDEQFRWAVRDAALEKFGEQGFETLASAVEAQGSYESVTAWMGRKGLTADECNTLILAAAVAGEERAQMVAAKDVAVAKGGRAAGQRGGPRGAIDARGDARGDAGFAAAFGESGLEDTASEEGLHARLLRDEEGSPDSGNRRR